MTFRRLYEYDNIGNRVSRTETTTARYYCANAVNQYTTIDDASGTCPQPPTPVEGLCYDADGNLVQEGKTSADCESMDG